MRVVISILESIVVNIRMRYFSQNNIEETKLCQ